MLLACNGFAAWTDGVKHLIVGAPVPQNNEDARNQGCADNSALLGDKIFPAWVPVQKARSLRGDQRIYPMAENYNTGYLAEEQKEIVATVAQSGVTAIDLPINHSRRTPGPSEGGPKQSARVVTNDWNLFVAPDVEYQHLLSDANLRHEGFMEVEWEQDDKSLATDAIPGVGAKVYIKGRWIYDCGHPPYRTEIHPPNILATLHPSKAAIRLSPEGGPVWFQHEDQNLPLREYEPVGNKCNVFERLKDHITGDDLELDALTDIGLSNILWLANTCERRTTLLAKLPPEKFCYQDHVRGYLDPVNPALNGPVSFDLPLPPTSQFPLTPFISITSGPATGIQADVRTEDGKGTFYRMSLNPHELPLTPTTVHFEHGAPLTSQEHLDVCFAINFKKNHDNFKPGKWEQAGATLYNVGNWLFGFGTDYVTCSKDKTQEPVVYFQANQETIRLGEQRPGAAPNCVQIKISPQEVLQVGSHGYECDLACQERWDDDLLNAHNDIVGEVNVAFDESDNFGIGTHKMFSQADPRTPRAAMESSKDYELTVTIRRSPR